MKNGTRIGIAAVSLFASLANAATLTWLPTTGTGSWFTADNWSGQTPAAAPAAGDSARIGALGVCAVDAVNAQCNNLQVGYNRSDEEEPTLVIESGASLDCVSKTIIGLDQTSHGFMDVRGDFTAAQLYVGGQNDAGPVGRMDINGGSVAIPTDHYFFVGASSTGTVTINSGELINVGKARVGVNQTYARDSFGHVVINGGTWNTTKTLFVGGGDGHGRVDVNGGQLIVGGSLITENGGGTGEVTINGGSNYVDCLDPGYTSGGGGTVVFDGGTTTVQSIRTGYASNALIVISNGTVRSTSSDWTYRSLQLDGAGNRLIVDGGNYLASNAAEQVNITIEDHAVLELRRGWFQHHSHDKEFRLLEDGVLRVVGPLCRIDIGYWNSTRSALATHELILTPESGHISRMRCTKQNGTRPTGQAGTLYVGFDGGALLMTTNVLPYIWTVSYFEDVTYDLDLWEVTQTFDPQPEGNGRQKELTLKSAEEAASLSMLGPTTAAFAARSYGYVELSDLALEEKRTHLRATLTVTPGAKSLSELVQDLQHAGYDASSAGSNLLIMDIPVSYVPDGTAYFAWDFREFDDTVNAEVTQVEFRAWPIFGSLFIMR